MNVTPLISAETIQRRVAELADALSRRYAEREVVLLVVLKGGIVFAADLMRRMTIPVVIDFVRARSYEGTESNGAVELTFSPETPLEGRDVIIVEDILDTGQTSHAIREWVRAKQPASVALCVLLDKPSRRRVDIEADFTGLVIDDHFVVGYGLDYEQQGRQFPDIGVLNGKERSI
ncbi:MAG: hypoxanthine phosphoribosyltransferase [Candidatus Hydrogenedentes bacterium]|nr:hypoxanthine phosphoribosyltransferase [Candidatus Hydrogenedentota bacterium]